MSHESQRTALWFLFTFFVHEEQGYSGVFGILGMGLMMGLVKEKSGGW